ncbi:hypothetical protein ACFL6I_12985 [candidate division KSB1 bacterium]
MIVSTSYILPRNGFYAHLSDKKHQEPDYLKSGGFPGSIHMADRLFNLGAKNRFIIQNRYTIDNNRELKTSLKIISSLLKKGVVGYEYLEVNGRPYKSFVTTGIGDQRIAGARLYRGTAFTSFI